jgi:Phosphatidyl serine synthase
MSARWLQHLFPELGQDLQERAYGSDCRLYIPEEKRVNWEVIKGTVFDEFVIAHTVGWWCAPCCDSSAAYCSHCRITPCSSSAQHCRTGFPACNEVQLLACYCC